MRIPLSFSVSSCIASIRHTCRYTAFASCRRGGTASSVPPYLRSCTYRDIRPSIRTPYILRVALQSALQNFNALLKLSDSLCLISVEFCHRTGQILHTFCTTALVCRCAAINAQPGFSPLPISLSAFGHNDYPFNSRRSCSALSANAESLPTVFLRC